jgi:hypothetical protein
MVREEGMIGFWISEKREIMVGLDWSKGWVKMYLFIWRSGEDVWEGRIF